MPKVEKIKTTSTKTTSAAPTSVTVLFKNTEATATGKDKEATEARTRPAKATEARTRPARAT